MDVREVLRKAVEEHASDIFIVAGLPISYRSNNVIIKEEGERLMPPETENYLEQIYELADHRDIDRLLKHGDDDFSFAVQGLSRFRVSAYKQRGALSAVVRVITFNLPKPEDIGIPQNIIDLGLQPKGMVLVTGPAGSGKSTTLACMVDALNRRCAKHIITLEDPIEYLHSHQQGIISQREINVDTENYVTALRASLRQSPDVILLGEMRDYETINIAMTAAETGHLVFSTLHTLGAANAVDRIIDVFPANQQRQVIVQLASVLNAVVSQQLLPDKEGKLIPAFELMTINRAIKNMIRENKVHQIDGLIASSSQEKMFSMDSYITKLYKEGKITQEVALDYAAAPELMVKTLLK